MENEAIKKLSLEMKHALEEKITSKEFKDFIKEMEDTKVEDSGQFEMIISTEHEDRSGEIVMQDGIDTANYLRNPIVLWAHDYSSMPVAVTDSLRTEVIKGVKSTIATGRFAPTEFGQELRKMYEQKFANTSSIGFMALEMQENKITKSQLLEWSFVPVPCNAFAERMKEVGINIEMLKEKGFSFEKKEGEEISNEEIKPEEKPEEETEKPKEEEKPVEEKPEEVIEEKKANEDDGDDDADYMTSIGAEINAMQGEIDTSIQTHMGKLMDLINAEEDGEKKSISISEKVCLSVKLAINTLKTSLATLEVVAKAMDPESSEEAKELPKQRSRDAKIDKETLESFLQLQSVMRLSKQSLDEGLYRVKKSLAKY